ncbi:Toll-like receptor 2 type-2 [Acipenser ruthenus]|uniref:Toll-like receptor 2 n=2 Tax=Acipenser ruthenus TaxID=7906 RepID=A0A444UC95_ACIRT|nr:toll-like receptor 2 type-2 isoform X2 [Acipenser ruthenus]RXM32803.1 Toll-like receptor 2 type-2 [Acipenser ruthenus]
MTYLLKVRKSTSKLQAQSIVVLGLYFIFCTRCVPAETEHVINCSAQNYPTTPCAFPSDTKTVDLSHNSMETILRQDFLGVRGLRKLYLQFNKISAVDPEAFQDNLELEYLDISNNRLHDISTLPFRSLPALNHLDITNNIDTDIILGPQFSSLQNLQTVKLGNPQISSLRENSFRELEGLPLKEFHLITGDFSEYEHSLKSLHGLEKITLEVNMWQNLELLKSLFEDIKNATKTLKIMSLDLVKSGKFVSLFSALERSQVESLALQNISMTDNNIANLLNASIKSEIEELSFDNILVDTIGNWRAQIEPFEQTHLRRFFIKNIYNPNFYKFYSLEYMVNLFRPLIKVSIVNAGLFYVPCIISDSLEVLESFNVTSNLIQEYSLFPGCHRPLPSLRSLVVDHNKFVDLPKLGLMTSHMKQLMNLSAEYNSLVFHSSTTCHWTESLKRLNLKGNFLLSNVFDCLPASLEVLDLSINNITVVSNIEKMRNLKEIYLSGNSIFTLAELSPLPALRILHADGNKITQVNLGMLKAFNLSELKFSNNPFECYCDIQDVSKYFENTMTSIIGWPENYQCQVPLSLKGTSFSSVSLSLAQCNPGIIAGITVVCIAILVALCILLCIKYNVPWYLRTLWLWVRAKKSTDIDLVERNLEYHAFLSYSEHDSTWVKTNLLKQLEESDPPYHVCIHERDFKPGKPIITNIIECISKSYKTIFVLSNNFVSSEWCHYEFFFAHHQVFDEKKDSLILLLLEPIPTNSIPDRFCKLRKLMNKNTYLEWPHDETRQSMFWKRLKAVLNQEIKAPSQQGSTGK